MLTRSTRGNPDPRSPIALLLLGGLVPALLIACADAPLTPSSLQPVLAKGPPPSCPAQINLTVGGLSGSLTSDGGDYTEGVGGVAAHTSAANGNLMFNVQNSSRTVTVTTSVGSGAQSTRIYTNNHEQACGLPGMAATGSAGTAVLEIDWNDGVSRFTLRYGKNCGGSVVAANKVASTRNGTVWTLAGDAGEGILCRGRLNGNPSWTQIGTGGAFTMTLSG